MVRSACHAWSARARRVKLHSACSASRCPGRVSRCTPCGLEARAHTRTHTHAHTRTHTHAHTHTRTHTAEAQKHAHAQRRRCFGCTHSGA
jgi:hypothetical protein